MLFEFVILFYFFFFFSSLSVWYLADKLRGNSPLNTFDWFLAILWSYCHLFSSLGTLLDVEKRWSGDGCTWLNNMWLVLGSPLEEGLTGLTMAKALSQQGKSFFTHSCWISLKFRRVVFRLMSALTKSCISFSLRVPIHKFTSNTHLSLLWSSKASACHTFGSPVLCSYLLAFLN